MRYWAATPSSPASCTMPGAFMANWMLTHST